ncbi:MAG: hypothetical protein JSS56_14955 [Proteobacteria bacterium]|nr:hypothetical protein [Pseudomonadota bacterium]
MTVLCSACSAENRDAAKFCRGCGRKIAQAWPQTAAVAMAAGVDALPGTAAPVPRPADSRLAAATDAVRPTPAPPRPRIGNGRWIVGLGLGVVLLVAATAWWAYQNKSREIPEPASAVSDAPGTLSPPSTIEEPASQAAPAVVAAPVPSAVPAQAPDVRSEPAPLAQVPQPSPKPSPRSIKKQAPPASATVPAAPIAPVPAHEAARLPTPQEICAGRNFIARAQCMADQCARPEVARHPQCEAVRQQQRIEEEKRNPTMAG